MKKIILASASKRRSQILSSCGIRHKVCIANIEEAHYQSRTATWNVRENAMRKASACAKRYKNSIVIGADTLVVLNKRLFGKPEDKSHAKKLFRAFSGKRLEIITGLCVIDTLSGKIDCGTEKSLLYAQELHEKDLDKYFAALKPYDKAGGFSIEGIGSFIYDDIKGSYFNILGLPMIKLKCLFEKLGLNILDFCLEVKTF
jgi:septum formation protein